MTFPSDVCSMPEAPRFSDIGSGTNGHTVDISQHRRVCRSAVQSARTRARVDRLERRPMFICGPHPNRPRNGTSMPSHQDGIRPPTRVRFATESRLLRLRGPCATLASSARSTER